MEECLWKPGHVPSVEKSTVKFRRATDLRRRGLGTPPRNLSANVACILTEDSCVLFDEDFLIRGCAEIHVHGRNEPFVWGVWVSLSREHFNRERALVRDPKRICRTTVLWVAVLQNTDLPRYSLAKNASARQVGTRPYIEIEPTDHPLAVEQRTGITEARVREIGELMEHRWLHPEWDAKGFWGGAV